MKRILKISAVTLVGALLLAALLVLAPVVSAGTWTQTSTSDFNEGQYYDVTVDDGTLKLGRQLATQIGGLSATPGWNATGEDEEDYFGGSVASAGDVNGDGYADVIVGADGYDDGGSEDAGKAYVYYGSSSGLSTSASWTKTGENADDYFGFPVASAGDVNNDGYEDVIVGASGYNGNTGKAYLYYGSSTGLSTSASWTQTGEYANDYFGDSVASAGDVNGDGYDEVIVGAEGYNNSTGKAYLYFGSSSGLSISASWTQTGENEDDDFGWPVAGAGDVDNDGADEVIVGASGYSSDAGRAYVFGGSTEYVPVGWFVSPKFSASSSNTVKWLSIEWDPVVQPEDTAVKFQVGANNDAVNFSFLGPDGTANTYYTLPHGQAIFSNQNGKFWRYKAYLYSNNIASIPKTPTITEVRINYEEYPFAPPTVTLASPNGWEVLIGGEEIPITWNAAGNLGATPISLYYSTDNGASWTAIATGIADTGYYSWIVPSVDTKIGLVKVVVTDVIANTDSDISDEPFFIGLVKDNITLHTGWNFVSIPAKLNNTHDEAQQVFAGVNTSGKPIYLYDDGNWAVMADSEIVKVLDGIWVYYASGTNPVNLTFDTNPRLTPPIKALEASWNAIGHSARVPVTADSTLSSVEDKWTYLVGLDASAQSYEPALINNDETGSSHDEDNPMYPTRGYWLYMTGADELGGISAGVSSSSAATATSASAATAAQIGQLSVSGLVCLRFPRHTTAPSP